MSNCSIPNIKGTAKDLGKVNQRVSKEEDEYEQAFDARSYNFPFFWRKKIYNLVAK